MNNTTTSDGAVELPPRAASQFSYHVRMAAVFGMAGKVAESASEAVLAWAILTALWPGAHDAALGATRELIGQELAGSSDAHRAAAIARAGAQALDLEAHFVSVGLHSEAALYASLAEQLDATAASLVNNHA